MMHACVSFKYAWIQVGIDALEEASDQQVGTPNPDHLRTAPVWCSSCCLRLTPALRV